ncbi:MAG: hypothetical protein IIA82_03815 [Thaumarchaeota archaeon]|nr:hypothetical protein [Nitrososphaerota archaeon]
MKNRAVTVFLLAYILLGSVYSVTPTFADNDFTIKTILDESNKVILDKFLEFETNGVVIPSAALSLYDEGFIQYEEALGFLAQEDFENAKDPGLEALSLFEDAYEVLFEAEEELFVEPEGYVGDILAIAESITALKDESTRIGDLIDINDLSIISLEELDALITSADTNFTQGNFAEALTLIESAEDVLNEVLKQIEYKAEEEQAERVSKYVKDLVGDLEDLISTATEAGLDASVISQFRDLVDILNNYESPSDVFDITGESSYHKDALDDVDEKTYKGKIEAELVDADEEDGGEAKFKQRGNRTELEVEIENQESGAVFTVHVNGDPVEGEITIEDDGDGKLKLKSKDGDTVPSLINEDGEIVGDGLIEIKDVDGFVVLSGTFSFEGDDDEAKEDDDDEDEIELKGFLRDNGDGTFDLTNEDETETIAAAIAVDDETEIDDDLSLSELDGLEVEVDAIDTDAGLLATEIEFDDYSGSSSDDDSDNSGSSSDDDSDNSGSSSDDDSDNSGSSSDDNSDNSGSSSDDNSDNSGSSSDDNSDNSGSSSDDDSDNQASD